MKEFFRTIEFTIAAGAQYRIAAYSNFLTVLENTSTEALQVGIGQQYRGELVKGLSVELPAGEKFTHLMFYNPTGSSMTVQIALSEGRVYDNRLVLSGLASVEQAANTLTTPAAVAAPAHPANATQIAAAANQVEIILSNTGTQTVYVGKNVASIDASNQRGTPIQPNQTIVLSTSADVYAQSVPAGAGQLSVNQLSKS